MPGLPRQPAAAVLAVPPGKQDTEARLGGREDSKDLVQRHIGIHIILFLSLIFFYAVIATAREPTVFSRRAIRLVVPSGAKRRGNLGLN